MTIDNKKILIILYTILYNLKYYTWKGKVAKNDNAKPVCYQQLQLEQFEYKLGQQDL